MPSIKSLALLLLATAACAPARQREATAAQVAIPARWAESRELTADEQVAHALNRLAFGPRPGDLARVRRLGVDEWIAQQLRPETIDDRRLSALKSRAYETLDKDAGELIRAYPPPNLLRAQARRAGMQMTAQDSTDLRQAALASQRIVAELQSAKVAHAVAGERQLEEVLVDFWENHFSVFAGKGPQMRYQLVEYSRDAIRPHALGKFRELLGAVARSPAMLTYLDNWQSMADSGRPTLRTMPPPLARRRRGLNENYARELLELHTLGVDGGYGQQDVIEVARALTGWTIGAPRLAAGGFVFRPEMHDAGEKVVLGQRLAAGRGRQDGEDVLDILARHPSTARHIALKLARRLVSDTPPAELVARAADTFTRTGGDIRETVRIIVASPEFWSRSAYRSKVKSPFETVVSAMRAMGAEADTSPRTARIVAMLGQPVYGHQAPNGWPETGSAWMNTGAILNRINFGLAVAAGRLPGARVNALPGAPELRTASRERQVDAVVSMFFAGAVSPDTRAVLMTGENPFAAAALAAGDDSTGAAGADPGILRRAPSLTGLDQIVGLALGAPEFQRR